MIGAFDKKIIDNINKILLDENNPFYLYDTSAIRHNCSQLTKIPYTNKSIHFAAMANDNPNYLKTIKREGLHIFVNSTEHLRLVEGLGFKREQIIFAASAMSRQTMRQVYDAGATVILDSLGQLDLWQRIYPHKAVGIRCNIGEIVTSKKTRGGYFIGKESRLGLNLDEIKAVYGSNNVCGLHVYVGTDILDVNYFIRCYKAILSISRSFPQLQFIDFGGGFGIGEKDSTNFNFLEYGQKLTRIMTGFSRMIGRPVKLILEPGRIIGGKAGYFVAKVNDIKMRGNKQLIGASASSVQFPRPLFYPDDAFHPVKIIHRSKKKAGSPMVSDIYGCSTYSRDYLARNILCEPVNIDDSIVFLNAGSYCASSFTNFLGFKKPKEYFCGN